MSTKPEELKRAFDRELNISDFQLVWEKAGVLSGRWDSIGILLGIGYKKLYEIESETKTARGCLQKVFDCWLKKDYDYKSHGVPTLRMLCNSIKSNSGGADPGLADEIAKEYSAHLIMSTKPEELKRAFDRELNISDFQLVWEKAGVLSGRWDSIGILLGLSPNKLDEIEARGKPPKTCLRKVFDCWLKKDYDYKNHGVPTLRMLCDSIKSNSGGADPALANEIAKEYTINLTSSGEATTLPACTSSSKETTPTTVKLQVSTAPTETSTIYVKKLTPFTPANSLIRLIQDLHDDFIHNMHLTKMAFHSINLSEVVDYIQSYVIILLSPRFRKHDTIKSMRDKFNNIKSMNQLFRVLQEYVSWFNFELVVKLVNTFITDERDLQRKWSTYREKLKDYFKNNTLAVQIADSIEFGLSDVPGTKVMVAMVARDDYTLNDLYFFHKAIADALEVPKYDFYFCTIDNGGRSSPIVHTSSSKETTPTAVKLQVSTAPTETSTIYVKKLTPFTPANSLIQLIQDLHDDFIHNMHLTKMAFRSINLSQVVDHIQSYIATLLSPRFQKHDTIESMREEFDNIKSMNQLFRVLQKYVSWFNFEFVVKLVNTFITDERDLQRKWSTYREKLKDYFKNNNTKAVQIADSIEFGLSDVPGTKVMVATVARDDYTLNDLYFFHKAIADALEVPEYDFYFCTIDNGGGSSPIVHTSSSKEALSEELKAKDMTIAKLTKEKIQLREEMQSLKATKGKKTADNLGLSNVRIGSKELFIIKGDKPQLLNWEKYGLRIKVFGGSLPSTETAEVVVVALVGGQFVFPKNTVLVSAVYAISVSRPLLKALKLEMQHCVDLSRGVKTKYLNFAIAPITPSLPYEFSIVDGGEFCEGNFYGSINREKFSFATIVGSLTNGEKKGDQQDLQEQQGEENGGHDSGGHQKRGGDHQQLEYKATQQQGAGNLEQEEEGESDEEIGGGEQHQGGQGQQHGAGLILENQKEEGQSGDHNQLSQEKEESFSQSTGISESIRYTGRVYYEVKGVEDQFTFAAVKELSTLIEYVEKHHSKAETGETFDFYFDGSSKYIELILDHTPQKYLFTGWTIQSHIEPCRLDKKTIDDFGANEYPVPPTRFISVRGSADPGTEPTLHYAVPLNGVLLTNSDKVPTIFIHRTLRNTTIATTPSNTASNNKPSEDTAKKSKKVTFTDLLLDKKPQNNDLVRLFKSSAAQYMLIGTALGVKVDDIQSNPQSTTNNLILVFQRWIDSNKGVTWRKVLQACNDYPEEFGKVKDEVEGFLSSERARDNYL